MANKTVIIDCDEQGQYKVGQMGAEGAPQMQPVDSLDAALDAARQMLGGGNEEQNSSPEQDEQQFNEGYKGAASPEMLSSRGM